MSGTCPCRLSTCSNLLRQVVNLFPPIHAGIHLCKKSPTRTPATPDSGLGQTWSGPVSMVWTSQHGSFQKLAGTVWGGWGPGGTFLAPVDACMNRRKQVDNRAAQVV